MNDHTYEIEAFRAGAPAAVAAGLDTAALDQVVTAYNADKNPAPLVLGHPSNDQPAKGIIAGVRREGESLFFKLKGVASDAIDGVRNGEWINRSAAFWHPRHPSNPTPGKWNIRHLGLLGAAAPGIPNMSKLTFSADDALIEGSEPAPAIIFTAPATQVVTIEEGNGMPTAEEIAASAAALETERAALAAEKAEFAAKQKVAADKVRADFEAGNAAYVDGLAKAGKIIPAAVPVLTAAFNALPVEAFEFSAEDKRPIGGALRAMFDAAKPQIIFEAITPRDKAPQFDANDVKQLEFAANKLVTEGKAVNFEAAVASLTEGA